MNRPRAGRTQGKSMRLTTMATALLLAGLMADASAAGSNTPVLRGNVFVFADGTQVRAADPAGRTGQVGSDGSIRWSDGTRVSHDITTGESRLERPDGSKEITNSHNPTRVGDTFVYSDGTRVRATDPSGAAGTLRKDGSIVYSDGTVFSHSVGTGDTNVDGFGSSCGKVFFGLLRSKDGKSDLRPDRVEPLLDMKVVEIGELAACAILEQRDDHRGIAHSSGRRAAAARCCAG